MSAEAGRIFTCRLTTFFLEKVHRRAWQRWKVKPIWVRSEHRGPTGKPYTLRRLAVVVDGKVVVVARLDRAGRVYWHEPGSNELFIPEPEETPDEPSGQP